MPQFLTTSHGEKIAYQRFQPSPTNQEGTRGQTGVIFLGGFMSNMEGTKAVYLETLCQTLGISYIRFDYFGHGQSSGKFEAENLSRWKSNVLQILDEVAEGPQVLVGSSMGGWLMILATLERPERVKGLVGIASAPDFTKDFGRLSPALREALDRDGICYLPSCYGDPYAVTKQFLEDGERHYILDKPISIHCPVHLLHGLADEQVSWESSVKLAQALLSKEVLVTLIKEGDHSLSDDNALTILSQTLQEILK